MPIFAGVLQPPEISSKISHCLCMAEARGSIPLGSTLREAYLSGNQVLVKALNPLAGGFVQQRQPSGIVWRFRWHARRFVGGGLFGGLFRGGIRRTAADGQEDRQSEGPNHDGAILLMPMATIPSPLPSSDVPNQRLARSRFPSKEKPKNPSDRKLVIEPTSISRLSRN